MKQQIIEKYIEEILGSTLKKLITNEKAIELIKEDIRINMYSLIYHWSDVEFRKAVLITGMEEGKFYSPDADDDVKCFVVLTVRNSYIEYIFSDFSYIIKVYKPVEEKYVRMVTEEAIRYFRDIDFSELSSKINTLENDKYGDIIRKYPVAWEALIQLSKATGKRVIYDKIFVKEKLLLDENNIADKARLLSGSNMLEMAECGIDIEFSQQLFDLLNNVIKNEKKIFYVDCFKMLTRNFEKLLKVIEFLLENDGVFVTSNYLLSNTYIGKREIIYRAVHSNKEMMSKFEDEAFLFNLSKYHKDILKLCIEEFV